MSVGHDEVTLEKNLLWKKILDHPLPPGYYILVLRATSILMETQPKDPGSCMARIHTGAKSAYKSSVCSTPATGRHYKGHMAMD